MVNSVFWAHRFSYKKDKLFLHNMVDIIMKNFLLCNYPIQLEFHDLWHMKLKYISLKENDMLKKKCLAN